MPSPRHNSHRTFIATWALCIAFLAGSTPARAQVEFVIAISVDGARSDLVSTMLETDTTGELANLQRFIDEGATTFNARTDFSHTNTLPNHTSMISGRPVMPPLGQANTVYHGYTNNGTPLVTDTLHNRGNPNVAYIASIFDVVHDHGRTTGLYASKSKFVIYAQSYNATNGAADAVAPDDGRAKLDTYIYMVAGSPSNASTLHAAFMNELNTAPRQFSFVHYRDPDSAGHASGWGSLPYQNAIRAVDDYLGEIFQAVDSNPALAGKTVLLLTSDHGGVGTGHSSASSPLNYTIPFFAWGVDVDAADLYALNADTRADPGSTRPDYNAAVPPIRSGDLANLALGLLGLPPVDGSTINAQQDLKLSTSTSVEGVSLSEFKSLYR